MRTQTTIEINNKSQPPRSVLNDMTTNKQVTLASRIGPRVKDRKTRSQDKHGRYSKYVRHRPIEALKAHRKLLADIAQDTLNVVLTTKAYHEDSADTGLTTGTFHDLSSQIQRSREESSFYPHRCPLLASWKDGPRLSQGPPTSTTYEFTRLTILSVARKLWTSNDDIRSGVSKIGVLNAATPRKPGGSSLAGGDTQEEFLVRQTTVFDSLQNSEAGEQFYLTHRFETDGSGLNDHALLYTPDVVAFKDDRGRCVSPMSIDVVSSVPVHAATVHSKHDVDPTVLTGGIHDVMKERMARILRLFEERGDRVLIIGSFGMGQFCISPTVVGEIWADLLLARGAKFEGVFDKVVFAIPGKHLPAFRSAFSGRCLELDILDSFSQSDDDDE